MFSTKFLISAVLILFAVARAPARIGETFEQCAIRYGAPVNREGGKNASFIKAGIVIAVTFFEGKVDTIAFCKVERDVLGKPKEMSENEISQFLQANSGNHSWKEVGQVSLDRYWITEDAQLAASYKTLDRFLMIMTKAATDRANAAKKAEEDKKLQGF